MTRYYNKFFARENLFNTEKYPEDIRELTAKQVEEIKDTISCQMSPENLHCDGEASKDEVDQKINSIAMLCREISSNTQFNVDFLELQY